MNRKLTRKSSSSFRAGASFYAKQSFGIAALGAVAGAVAPILAIASHFPGW